MTLIFSSAKCQVNQFCSLFSFICGTDNLRQGLILFPFRVSSCGHQGCLVPNNCGTSVMANVISGKEGGATGRCLVSFRLPLLDVKLTTGVS